MSLSAVVLMPSGGIVDVFCGIKNIFGGFLSLSVSSAVGTVDDDSEGLPEPTKLIKLTRLETIYFINNSSLIC